MIEETPLEMFKYEQSTGGIIITKSIEGLKGVVSFPENTVEICKDALSFCREVTEIYIPASVEKIGETPFYSCEALEKIEVDGNNSAYVSVNGALYTKDMRELVAYPQALAKGDIKIPEGVCEISAYAFAYYNEVTSIELPKEVSFIGEGAFLGCDKLGSIEVDPFNTSYQSIDGCLFDMDGKRIIVYPDGKQDAEYQVPVGTEIVGKGAFKRNNYIESIIFPYGVKKIETDAIGYLLENLKRVQIPSSVEVLEKDALDLCDGVTVYCVMNELPEGWDKLLGEAKEIVLVEEVVDDGYIGKGAEEFTPLEDFDYEETENGINIKKYRGSDYSVVLPYGVKTVGEHAFNSNETIEKIKLSDETETVGYNSFSYCHKLKSIELSPCLRVIEPMAFAMCEGVETVDLPDTLEKIGYNAFMSCSIKNVYIPKSVKELDASAFFCDTLEHVEVSFDSITYKSVDGVLYKKDMKEIILHPVNRLGDSYEIPEGVEIIGESAFYACKGLKCVTIPDSVKEIRRHAFGFCEGIGEIIIPNGVEKIDSEAFIRCADMTVLYEGEAILAQWNEAFKEVKEVKLIPIRRVVKSEPVEEKKKGFFSFLFKKKQ